MPSITAQRKREDQAMQFLRGLNDQYNNIKAHVLLMELVLDITKNISLVVQQEHRFNSNVPVANIRNVSPVTHTNNTTFSFCGKLGHTENVCFKKNGFPNQDNKGPNFSNGKRFCTYYNRTSHTIDICYKKHGYPPGYKS